MKERRRKPNRETNKQKWKQLFSGPDLPDNLGRGGEGGGQAGRRGERGLFNSGSSFTCAVNVFCQIKAHNCTKNQTSINPLKPRDSAVIWDHLIFVRDYSIFSSTFPPSLKRFPFLLLLPLPWIWLWIWLWIWPWIWSWLTGGTLLEGPFERNLNFLLQIRQKWSQCCWPTAPPSTLRAAGCCRRSSFLFPICGRMLLVTARLVSSLFLFRGA